MNEVRIPTVDLGRWLTGTAAERERIARSVDEALGRAGFLLITGHGVTEQEREEIRSAAREFFALPAEAKNRYAVSVGGRGWLGRGAEANGYSEGTETPPDLKESWTMGSEEATGDSELDEFWFQRNVWPSAEAPGLQAVVERYLAKMRTVADNTLHLLAAALGQPADFFTRHTGASTYTCNINWYPSVGVVGRPLPGQYRIGPHTDFGTVTLLDRQQGKGGLQVWTEQQGWADAPYDPAALTVNIGDLMARWTGDRWRSGRHRVLPPSPQAPEKELMSLVYFYECDPHTEVAPLPAPIGRVEYEPVDSTEYLRAKLDAITVA
ncbi:2-oxoglutarate and iron-dependent oxygenase domain-containing protein [Kitasatospora sp. NPDC050463]|uniref:isopenicillin N synthase family dioxygenase n=1 Tax=Kitasatospora sp. NPDC050463 TaxID=3155786 RepID=UPI0033E7B8EC